MSRAPFASAHPGPGSGSSPPGGRSRLHAPDRTPFLAVALLVLTAFGTASIVGGSWMITNGNRVRREPMKPRGPVKPSEPVKPADKTTIGGPT